MAAIGDLLSRWKLGGLSTDDKLSILEHYDIKFDRREIARELSNTIGDKVREAKRTNYSEAFAKATTEDVSKAVNKILDKYIREAESRFRVEQQKKLREEELKKKHGEKQGKKLSENQLWRWVSVTGDKRRCPDCKERHGQERLISEWEKLGIPRSGATVCKQYCRCRLVAVDTPGEGEGIEPEKPKPITGEEVRKAVEEDLRKIGEGKDKLHEQSQRILKDVDALYDKYKTDQGIYEDTEAKKQLLGLFDEQEKVAKQLQHYHLKENQVFDKILFVDNPTKIKYKYARGRKDPKLKRITEEAIAKVEKMVDASVLEEIDLKIYQRKGRAKAWHKEVWLDPDDLRGGNVPVHEIGHCIEFQNKEIHDKCMDFLKKRGAADPEGIVSLQKMFPGAGYRAGEKAWKDKFINAYAGKYYTAEHATEILSMGIQWLHSTPGDFLNRDPEYFEFIVNVLRGY